MIGEILTATFGGIFVLFLLMALASYAGSFISTDGKEDENE